jgi:ribosomal-protein-alanine N-acetyltransferase
MNLDEISWRPPRIETARLLLRGYESSDAQAIYEYASDPKVTPYMAFDRAQSLDSIYAFLNTRAERYAECALDYVITERHDPSLAIGGMGLYWHSKPHRVMEIGYILSSRCWGRGYVPEAGRALIAHGFQTTPAERIFAPIFAPNQKSRRAAEKMGLSFEGILRSVSEHQGRRWDEAVYAVLRDEHASSARTGDAD